MFTLLLAVPAVRGGDSMYLNDSTGDGNMTMILTTYSSTYRWSHNVLQRISSHLTGRNGQMPPTMHIPMVGVKTREQLDSLARDLRNKIKAVKPKRMVVVSSTAFAFCEDINAVCPNIPMLLIGGQDYCGTKDQIMPRRALVKEQCMTAADLQRKYNATVQTMPVFLREEMRMIRQMMPGLKNIYFVGGQDVFSRTREAELRGILKAEHSELEYHYMWSEEMSLNALIDTVTNLNPKTDAVIYSSWQDMNLYAKTPLLMTNSLFVMNMSTAPVFLIRDNGWVEEHRDVTGGCFLDENAFFDHLDVVLDQFVNTNLASAIPPYKAGRPIMKFNYNKLVSMGITPSLCPKGTIFINKPENAWEKYRYVILTGGIVVMLALLVLLFYAYYSSLKVQDEQRKRLGAYEALQKERYRNEEFLANIPIGYMRAGVVRGDDGSITDLSLLNTNSGLKDFLTMFKGAETKRLSEIIPLTIPALLEKLNECRSMGENVVRGMLYVPDGDKYIYIVVLFADDDTLGALWRDDTENIKKGIQLREAMKRVERSDRLKSEFVKNINHEVRTPLNSVCGFSELLVDPMLSDTFSDEEKAQMHQAISSSAAQIALLMNNMLTYSELLNESMGMEIVEAKANGLAQLSLGDTAKLVPQGVEVSYESTVPDSFKIHTCINNVHIALVNMLSNAFKFTQQGKVTLRFETDEANGVCRYICTDTGCGVPEDKVDFIFDSYAQVNEFVPGMGLGLYLARRVVEMLDGRIFVDTTYKEGARFVLELKL